MRYVTTGWQKIVSFIKTIFRVQGKQGKSGTKIVFGGSEIDVPCQFLSSNYYTKYFIPFEGKINDKSSGDIIKITVHDIIREI